MLTGVGAPEDAGPVEVASNPRDLVVVESGVCREVRSFSEFYL